MPRRLYDRYTSAEQQVFVDHSKWLLNRCDGDRELAVNAALEVLMVFTFGGYPTNASAAASIHEAVDKWVELNGDFADQYFQASRPKVT